MSPGQVSFPINHAWRSQAAFTWAEVFIYYIDHLPQVEELGERTRGLSVSAITDCRVQPVHHTVQVLIEQVGMDV